MSVYRLGSDAWQHVLHYLGASDILELLCIGDSTIQRQLKQAISDFSVRLRTTSPPRLSSLLAVFNRVSRKPIRLSISVEDYYGLLRFVPEEYDAEKWKSFFPRTLQVLQLSLDCNSPPFSSLLSSLAAVAPLLTTLSVIKLPSEFTLPPTLTKLDLDLTGAQVVNQAVLEYPTLFYQLPTTLTHLKIETTFGLLTDITPSLMPFKQMPLRVFHASIHFVSLARKHARWSILPNTITDLRAKFTYGNELNVFDAPMVPTWAQLFPSLTAINAPLSYLADKSIVRKCNPSLGEEIYSEQISKLASSFPASLTSLKSIVILQYSKSTDIEPILHAIGPRLKTFWFNGELVDPSLIKMLPIWENPIITLLDKNKPMIRFSNIDIFENDKDHPISQLYRNATSLNPGEMSASAISLLPRTLTSLDFSVLREESLSLQSVTDASKRNSARNNINDHGIDNMNTNPQLGWTQLGWPTALTKLKIEFWTTSICLHFGCLPATLTEFRLQSLSAWEFEGGDLAHITDLKNLYIYGATNNSTNIFTTLHGLPRSLQSIFICLAPCANEVFENPELQIFFSKLESLILDGVSYSANVLLWVPPTLTSLSLIATGKEACWSEKQFENLSRTKMVRLVLCGYAKWPADLRFDVFSRYLPSTLASLCLQIADWDRKGFERDIAPHIPKRLLSFQSFPLLQTAVANEKARANN